MRHLTLKGIAAAMSLLISTGVQALDQVGGVYQIGSAQDLVDFAALVNKDQTDLKAVLTADVDLEGVEGPCIDKFSGTFDGQGFAIHNYNFTTTSTNQGLFGEVTGATICNFTIDGTLNADHGATALIGYADANTTISGIDCAMNVNINNAGHSGGIVGSLRKAWIDRCTFSGVLTLLHSRGDSDGAIAGYTSSGFITNCVFSGKIVITQGTNNLGGILGYVNSTDFRGIRGCLSYGTFEGSVGKAAGILGNANTNTQSEMLTGNYVVAGTAPIGMNGAKAVVVPEVTEEQLASGEVCYKLNEYNDEPAWFQQIGTDPMPTRTGTAVVYQVGELYCDGTAKDNLTYSNTPGTATQDDHQFDENGFCEVCGTLKRGEDGFYEINTGEALRWVAEQVNSGNVPMNLRFTADLDLGGENWTPIGNDARMFEGEVDGGFHTISNMVVDHQDAGAGLFGTVVQGTFRNLYIDASCSVTGVRYAGGLIGHSYAGNVTIEGVGVMCDVTCTGEAAAGLIGNANNASVCNISHCFTTGAISAKKDAACFSGWEGNVGAVIENCWSVSEVTGYESEARYLARYGGLTLRNCFSVYGTQGTHIEFDDIASGRLTWLLNGKTFMNPTWFQTITEDNYPRLDDPTRGVVYEVVDGVYGCITDEESFQVFRTAVIKAEEDFAAAAIANTATVEDYKQQVAAVAAIADRNEFLAAFSQLSQSREAVKSSVKAYEAYRAACEEMMAYLEENPLSGDLIALLDEYLNADVEPGDILPDGSFTHIMNTRTLDNEQLQAQEAWMKDVVKQAIAADYQPGSEVTSLIHNADFALGTEGWNLAGSAPSIANIDGVGVAAEQYNKLFDLNQTLTGLKNGIYVLQVNAAFRAYADINSTLHAGQLYMNDNATFVMMENEDFISKDQAVDGENCHITGSNTDYTLIYGDVEGWVPVGPVGCAYAFKGGRYVNYIAAEVTDGTLNIGITNPGTGLERDWTAFGNFRLFYLGDGSDNAGQLDKVLQGYAARTATILAFVPSQAEDYNKYPNFDENLKVQLAACVEAIPEAQTAEQKMALVSTFSMLFAEVYSCRNTYIAMVKTAESVQTIAQTMVDQGFIQPEEVATVMADYDNAWYAFTDGAFSAEEAEEMILKFNSNDLYPTFENDAFQLTSTRDWQIFALMVNAGAADINAELRADLDFAETGFVPIGWNLIDDCVGANDTYVYRGTFDGKGHTISNAVVYKPAAIGAGYFGSIGSPAVIKNLRFDNTCAVTGKDRAGLVGRSTGAGEIWLENLGNEGTVTSDIAAAGILGNANSGSIGRLSNCYSTGDIIQNTGVSWKNCAQICGWFGAVGATIDNCWSISNVGGHDGMDNIFSRRANDQAVFTNCYSNTGDGSRATRVSAGMVTSGELAFLLNQGGTEEPLWRQTLGQDSHPVLNATHLIVYKKDDGTFYNQSEDAILSIREELGGMVSVLDMQGRVVRDKVPAGGSLTGMPAGLYILKGEKTARKVMVK